MAEKLKERTLLRFFDENNEMVKILEGTLNLEIGDKAAFYSQKNYKVRNGRYEVIKRDIDWVEFSLCETGDTFDCNKYYTLKRIGSLNDKDI